MEIKDGKILGRFLTKIVNQSLSTKLRLRVRFNRANIRKILYVHEDHNYSNFLSSLDLIC